MRPGFVLTALLGAVSLQSQALADGTIAIARTNDERGFSLGVSFNSASRADADAEAIHQCELSENAHPVNLRAKCNIVATYDNMCMALAKDIGDGGTAWGWGTDGLQMDADDRAMRECRTNAGDRADQCEITMRHCDGTADSAKQS